MPGVLQANTKFVLKYSRPYLKIFQQACVPAAPPVPLAPGRAGFWQCPGLQGAACSPGRTHARAGVRRIMQVLGGKGCMSCMGKRVPKCTPTIEKQCG